MPFTPDPRAFYPTVFSRSKLLLMPSLWNESFGLVAAEAMLNGIPVLASNRGRFRRLWRARAGSRSGEFRADGTRSVPATLPGEGTGGFLFDIPVRYTPETCCPKPARTA